MTLFFESCTNSNISAKTIHIYISNRQASPTAKCDFQYLKTRSLMGAIVRLNS